MGVMASGWIGVKWEIIKWTFLFLTIVKAGFIVMSFMHLGEERKITQYTILAPYLMFIAYLIFICLTESTYHYGIRIFGI